MAHWAREWLQTDLSPRPLGDALLKANFITTGMSLDTSQEDRSLSPTHKLTIKSGPQCISIDNHSELTHARLLRLQLSGKHISAVNVKTVNVTVVFHY